MEDCYFAAALSCILFGYVVVFVLLICVATVFDLYCIIWCAY